MRRRRGAQARNLHGRVWNGRRSNPAGKNAATKNPARTRRAGSEKSPRRAAGAAAAAYFLAKMNFATWDLWCEAVLRWMTLLFTALSSAEL